MKTRSPEQLGFSSSRLRRVDDALQNYVEKDQLPGVSALIARRGEVVYRANYGLMDIENQKPMADDTIFRIYSMTKLVTCAAMMMLFEEGHFQLHDRISRYIPEFKDMKVFKGYSAGGIDVEDAHSEITIHQLLTHTSGIAYGLDDNPLDEIYREADILGYPYFVLKPPLPEFIRRLTALPLAFHPGTAWRYGLSHDVLGYLIEILADMPYPEFLEQRIFKPLGMVDTGFHVEPEQYHRLSGMYKYVSGEWKLIDTSRPSSPFFNPNITPTGGGGLLSTMEDYRRFCQMMLNKGELDGQRLLGRKTVELMTRNNIPDGIVPRYGALVGQGNGYAMGAAVLTDAAQRGSLCSEGTYEWGGAATTWYWIDPQEEIIGIIMTQIYYRWLLEIPLEPLFKTFTYQALID